MEDYANTLQKVLVKRFKVHSKLTCTTGNLSVEFAVTSTPDNSTVKELWDALTSNVKKKATLAFKDKNLPGSVRS